jgi:hypothetical protein
VPAFLIVVLLCDLGCLFNVRGGKVNNLHLQFPFLHHSYDCFDLRRVSVERNKTGHDLGRVPKKSRTTKGSVNGLSGPLREHLGPYPVLDGAHLTYRHKNASF